VEHSAGVAQSRAALLEAIRHDHELTLVRGFGNIGDELIRAGTHRLLEDHIFREIGVDELPCSSGDTVLLPGSGAFSRGYHEWMPRALAVAELRFDRVIVLPSSFDVREDAVRRSLQRTGATVFARELESLRRIEGLCRARLAHDCAFFFDFSGFQAPGEGILNAFRTDREATDGELTLVDNDDISVTTPSLEAWLAEIERHALVRTDRAHVLIAAALMGKQVEYAPNGYHKLDALAAGPLRGFPVRRIDAPRRPSVDGPPISELAAATRERLRAAAVPRQSTNHAGAPARVTAVILTRNRDGLVQSAVGSVTAATVPIRALVIDNNSGPEARRALESLAADPRVQVRLGDRNLGCAGGRRLAAELVDTEMVLFLDDDAELIDGALEHMIADLDAHPDAAGVTAVVVGPDGNVQHYGGWMAVSDDAVRFGLDCYGLPFDDSSLPATGPSGWVPGTASLLRTQILREVALDDGMAAYYEDNDWCYRVEQRRPGSFRRCGEALALHHHDFTAAPESPSRLVSRYETVERLATMAHFFATNGLLLEVDLVTLVPELRRPDGSVDPVTARLLMSLIAANGVDWTVAEWMNGRLEPLLDRAEIARLRAEGGVQQAQIAQLEAHAAHLEAYAAEVQAHAVALEDRVTALQAERSQTGERVAWLEDRHQTLCAVEAGGWWRLRSRVQPLLGPAARVWARIVGDRG
jgi:GT2 family glycosyltransferase/exopolysaccharide biosynthesis predicted pyruvyltransferase EpsI